jgi:NAD(P) transhydrogenase subunit alpha
MAVVAITKERQGGETRVAATPDSIRKLIAMGLKVRIESGAGDGASIPDAEYVAAGATIAKGAAATIKDADLLFKVRAPDAAEVAAL